MKLYNEFSSYLIKNVYVSFQSVCTLCLDNWLLLSHYHDYLVVLPTTFTSLF